MHLFWLLVFAHFVGDFALQTDKIYFYKRNYKWGVSVHVAVCMGVKVLLMMPYLHLPKVWMILFVLGLLHVAIDHGKIVISEKYRADNIWFFLADQTLHLCSIFILTWLLFDFQNPQPSYFLLAPYVLRLNTETLILLTGLVIATFSGAPLIYYISVFITKNSDHKFPKFKQRLLGYFERCIATAGVILGGWYLLLLLSFAPRYCLMRSMWKGRYTLVETVLGVILAVTVGLCVR